MSKRIRILAAALGWLAGCLARSDNAPFFVMLGALTGMWVGLAWARAARPLVLGAIGLLALLLLAILFTPPRAPIQVPGYLLFVLIVVGQSCTTRTATPKTERN